MSSRGARAPCSSGSTRAPGASAFVGPLGGCRDLKYSRSAKDLLKSRSHDETSQMFCRSQSQREFERARVRLVVRANRPDGALRAERPHRARFTPTAKSLTMKPRRASEGHHVRRREARAGRKPRGAAATPVVTAPAAYNTMAFGADADRDQARAHCPSEDAAWPKLLPSLDSPNSKRMRLRQERSVDESRYLAPTPKLMSMTGARGPAARRFRPLGPARGISAGTPLHLQLDGRARCRPRPRR